MKTIDAILQLKDQQHASHNELVTLMNKGFTDIHAAMASHAEEDTRRFAAVDLRFQPVEETRRTLRAAVGAVLVQVLVLIGGAAMVLWKSGLR